MVALSIVVPLYNEVDNVQPLYLAITSAMAGKIDSYEVVLVDDGSKDDTYYRAAMLVDQDPRIRVVRFRRNYGQTAAMAAGIKHARGDVIITMDGDLQNDPTDIPMLLSLLRHHLLDLLTASPSAIKRIIKAPAQTPQTAITWSS